MPATIWETLHSVDMQFAERKPFDMDEFDALLETAGQGRNSPVIGPKNTAKHRALELMASDRYRKAFLVVQHAKVCLEHFEYFKRDFVDPGEYSHAVRLKKYQEMPDDRAMRLAPIFTPEILETFPELREYSERWAEWSGGYQKDLEQVYGVTRWMPQSERNRERCRLFRGCFLQRYQELIVLLRDLIALGE